MGRINHQLYRLLSVAVVVVCSRYFAKMDHVDDSRPLAVFGWVSTTVINRDQLTNQSMDQSANLCSYSTLTVYTI